MAEHQDLQSLSFDEKTLAFAKVSKNNLPEDKYEAFIKGFIKTLSPREKKIFEIFLGWYQRMICFYRKQNMSLTEEERLSLLEEKQLLINETELDEKILADMFSTSLALFLRLQNASTEEEAKSIFEERDNYFQKVYYKEDLERALYAKLPIALSCV